MYTTLALFNLVDVCDGLKPSFNPAAPIPALPVDSQLTAGGLQCMQTAKQVVWRADSTDHCHAMDCGRRHLSQQRP